WPCAWPPACSWWPPSVRCRWRAGSLLGMNGATATNRHNTAWRRVEIGGFCLALTAGCVNAIALLGFNRQGVSHLSGSSSLPGVALAQGQPAAALRMRLLLLSFVLGATIGCVIGNQSLRLGRRYDMALLAESLPRCWRCRCSSAAATGATTWPRSAAACRTPRPAPTAARWCAPPMSPACSPTSASCSASAARPGGGPPAHPALPDPDRTRGTPLAAQGTLHRLR